MQGLQKNIHWECSQKDLRMALMPQGWSPLGALGVAVSFWAPQAEGRCANKRWFPLINLSSSEKLCPGEGKKEKAQSWGWRRKDCKEMKWGSCRSSKAEWIQDISMASDSAESWKKWELFPNKTKFLPSSYVSTKMMSDNFQIKKELENKIILHTLRLRVLHCRMQCWVSRRHRPTQANYTQDDRLASKQWNDLWLKTRLKTLLWNTGSSSFHNPITWEPTHSLLVYCNVCE